MAIFGMLAYSINAIPINGAPRRDRASLLMGSDDPGLELKNSRVGEKMKTTIMVPVLVLLIMTTVALLHEGMTNSKYLAKKACDERPAYCFTPPVSFASLR